MPTRKSPRKGSLQFWPRKRVNKRLPRVNWDAINSDSSPSNAGGPKGFIGYKAGMVSAFVKDNTPNSMTKDKRITLPVTLIECPPMKIFSVRFYKNSRVVDEIILEGTDKELKKILKLPKNAKGKNALESVKGDDYDDLRIIAYSVVKKTNIKKKPDLTEIALNGTKEEKLNFIKENIGKEIPLSSVFKESEIIDVRGLTKGKGFQGPVRRFGIQLKDHKSEKGRRRPGSLGPWHPARVTFRVPMAGQLGMFTRVTYNLNIIKSKKSGEDNLEGIKNYGNIKSDYIIVRGSVQGPSKRQLLLTKALRPTKRTTKKNYEFLEIR